MFQTLTFTQPVCRQPAQPRPRPEHYAITPMVTNRPCIIQPANDDDGGEGSYQAGSRTILPCEGDEPSIYIEWDDSGRIVSSGSQSTRAGCGSSGGS